VQATQNAVGCNTNLGIILLCAPIIQACYELKKCELKSVESESVELKSVELENSELKNSKFKQNKLINHSIQLANNWQNSSKPEPITVSAFALPLPLPFTNNQSFISQSDLQQSLQTVLDNTSTQDAKDCFAAIALANPAGLGVSAQYDIYQPVRCNLLQAMQFAKSYDLIAMQYSNYFNDIVNIGLVAYQQANTLFDNDAWSTTACYLTLLAQFDDTHIVRKRGEQVALNIRMQANHHLLQLMNCQNPKLYLKTLMDWDAQLKAQGVNPGTCADMTVATLFVQNVLNL
jgi:triphosphoribosyl-dephospho-CoA synthetase